MKELISRNQPQFKANLHCHSTLSDGKKTPEELKAAYRAHGYSILAITDHEFPHDHSAMNEPDFLMLTGYEAHFRTTPDGRYDQYLPELHLNLFAKDPANETLICFDPNYATFLLKRGAAENVRHAGSEGSRILTREYVQNFIDTARENGYLVAYNHPYWSMQSEADILSYERLFSLEIQNYSSFVMNHTEYCGALYDKLLYSGKRMFCHGSDDNHNGSPDDHPNCDSYGGFTCILADGLTYPAVIDALEKGNFYASGGPEIRSLTVDGDVFHVECSPAAQIVLFDGGKSPHFLRARPGETLTSADLKIRPTSLYARISVFDEAGRSADTRGYFPEEWN